MLNTIHKFYIWHIMCKVPEKLKSVEEHDKAKNELKAVLYDSVNSTTFEIN